MRCVCGGQLQVIDTHSLVDKTFRMRRCRDCRKLYGPTEEHRILAVPGSLPYPWANKRRLANGRRVSPRTQSPGKHESDGT